MNRGEAEVKGPGLEPLLQDLRRDFLYDMRVRNGSRGPSAQEECHLEERGREGRAKGVPLQPYREEVAEGRKRKISSFPRTLGPSHLLVGCGSKEEGTPKGEERFRVESLSNRLGT